MDIGNLQPVDKIPPNARKQSIEFDISTDSRSSEDRNNSSSAIENRFLKKASIGQSEHVAVDLRSQSETSIISSKSSSKRSKSEKSEKGNILKSAGKEGKGSVPISVQIEVKKREEEKRIENELIDIQVALQEKRQER